MSGPYLAVGSIEWYRAERDRLRRDNAELLAALVSTQRQLALAMVNAPAVHLADLQTQYAVNRAAVAKAKAKEKGEQP